MAPRTSLIATIGFAGFLLAGSVSAQEPLPSAEAPDALPMPDQFQPGAPRSEPAPIQPAPAQPGIVQPAPAQPAPIQPAPVEPVRPDPIQPAPLQPVQPAPLEPAPRAPVNPAAIPPAPAGPAPARRDSTFVPSPAPVLPAAPADERVPPLVAAIRDRIAGADELAGIQITGGEVVVADFAPRQDLRIVATGGTLAGRARLTQEVRPLIEENAAWKSWLEQNGYTVVFADPPADSAAFVPLSPRPEEPAHLVELMQRVQDQIELDAALSGALVVRGTFYGRDGIDARELRIVGRLASDDQRQALERVFVEVMAANPYWRDMRRTVFVTFDTLRVAPPSPLLAGRYYAMGLDAFRAGDLTTASAAFTRAIAEEPGSLVFRYWRVVVHLAACETARAEAKLRPLVTHNIWGHHDVLIAREFERLQGPLRWQLAIMERDILLTLDP